MGKKQIRKENQMREEKLRVEELLSKIPVEMRTKYHLNIDYSDNCLGIHEPSYINIEKPEIDKNNDCVITIKNKKILVTLWKNVSLMHVVVF